MLHDLTMNSDYVKLKQTAAERSMWRYSTVSRTCSSTAEDKYLENFTLCKIWL